jgi:hypothetical protein
MSENYLHTTCDAALTLTARQILEAAEFAGIEAFADPNSDDLNDEYCIRTGIIAGSPEQGLDPYEGLLIESLHYPEDGAVPLSGEQPFNEYEPVIDEGFLRLAAQYHGWAGEIARRQLALRDKLKIAEKRIAELDSSKSQLINERDRAEAALSDMYKKVIGNTPEWNNWFSYSAAIEEVETVCELWRSVNDDALQFRQRITELEARSVKLPKFNVIEVMHMSGYNRDYAEGWCAGNDNARHEIRSVGINIEGSE